MKRNSIICLVFSICSFLIISYYLLSLPFKSYDVNLSDNNYYIAHGGGGIDGYTYTNYLDFRSAGSPPTTRNADLGFRVVRTVVE